MKVRYRVESNQKKKSQVKVKLTIPNVKNADAKYMDGQVITPSYDSAKNITTYEFTANASKDAPVSECVFQFVPNTAGSITMKLVRGFLTMQRQDDSIQCSVVWLEKDKGEMRGHEQTFQLAADVIENIADGTTGMIVRLCREQSSEP